jgi:tetraacyldisaccharide 4'-kinase
MRAPEFWTGARPLDRLLAAALAPVGQVYGATVAYKAAHAKPYRSREKVICVGNLTAGGTGKTPVAIAIAKAVFARGLRPFFLTRGYGGAADSAKLVDPEADNAASVGDEALLLAAVTPAVVSRQRATGAMLAERSGADVIVMDDGHQNFSLAKDLSLVVIDAEQGFGNDRLIPAGPLREPVKKGLNRADAVIVLGEAEMILPNFSKPVLRARLVSPDGDWVRGRRVVAFAGIGRPEKFFRTLRQAGADVVATTGFADHHRYSAAELRRLRKMADEKTAILVTTEKDFVRLAPDERRNIHALSVTARFEDENVLSRLLDGISAPV